MAGLKQELGLVQGIGLLSTSLLGTGVFAVPALVALIANQESLWGWPLLIALVFPVALVFAALGRLFPSAGGVAHFVNMAFGPRLAKATGWLFLSVIPVGIPAALQIASGFWQAAFGFGATELLFVQLFTILVIWFLGTRGAGSSANVQSLIAVLVIVMVVAIWLKARITPAQIPWTPIAQISPDNMFNVMAVMFWCFVGIEAFAHLASEFKHPERDFPRALIIGLLLAGVVYWAATVIILHFHAYSENMQAAAALPGVMVKLFGSQALWISCIIGYLACFASMNIYIQSFTRLVWSQSQEYSPEGWLSRLSKKQTPVNALSIVVLCTLVFNLLIYWFELSLDTLIVYANGIFVLVYLLCTLAGCRLLSGKPKILAIVSAVICTLFLVMIGWKSLYALVMLLVFWIVLPLFSARNVQVKRSL